jgi:hypothetical protein
MNSSESNLKKQLLVDEELANIFKKYDIPTSHITPYGIISYLLEKNASFEDQYDLHYNTYFSTSLLNNGNRWQ